MIAAENVLPKDKMEPLPFSLELACKLHSYAGLVHFNLTSRLHLSLDQFPNSLFHVEELFKMANESVLDLEFLKTDSLYHSPGY